MKFYLQKGVKLGAGGFASVYRATELTSGRAVALKQSRVSHKVRRPLLEHEARVLKLLSGHPTIPEIYGYGRFGRFEFLSMQLLDKSLGDTVDASGPLSVDRVSNIAIQLISALEHIHNQRLIHRDIKPDNILFQNEGSTQVCLIDFGLTYPVPSAIQVDESRSAQKSGIRTVFGTLPYASLNAHQGLKLTYRDDLESLAYTLIFLLRGSLPWSHFTRHSTIYGRIRQVHAQKRRLGGLPLATGFPDAFGDLLDYARGLSSDQLPNYQEWQKRFKSGLETLIKDPPCALPKTPPGPQDSHLPSPIRPGQLVLLKLIPSITAEGYSIQAGHERSFVNDPRFDEPEWNCPPRPCIILKMEWDARATAYVLTVASISNNGDLKQAASLRVPIINASSPPCSKGIVLSTMPDWPFDSSYCYVFKRLSKFYYIPAQEPIVSDWKVDPSGIDGIIKNLTPPPNPNPFASLHDSESPNPDIRHDAKMRTGYVKQYAQVLPLTTAEINCESVDWNSTRGWFDECVKAARYYDKCNGDSWTHTSGTQSSEESESDFSGSASDYEEDFEEWENRQQLKDRSVTLATVLDNKDARSASLLEGLYEIELEH